MMKMIGSKINYEELIWQLIHNNDYDQKEAVSIANIIFFESEKKPLTNEEKINKYYLEV